MRVGTYQKVLFATLSVAYLQPFVQGIVMTVTVGGIMDGLGLTERQMGVLGAWYLIPYACSMLASGMVSAYFGPRRTLCGMFLLAACGGLLFSSAESFAAACAGRAMTALGTAVCMTASFTLFGRWFRAESFAKVTGVFFAIGGSGSFLGAAPLAMANEAFGWRGCYAGMAYVTLFFAVLVFAVVRDWPGAEAEKELGIDAAPRAQIALADMEEGLKVLVRDRDFRRLAVWFCGVTSMYTPFVGLWAAPYYTDVFGLTPVQAGFAVSMAALGFIAGCPLVNWICEAKLRSNRIALGASGVAAGILFLAFFLLPGRLGTAGVVALSTLLGVAVNAPNTILYASVRNIFGSKLGSVASGILAGMSQTTGALAQMWTSAFLSAGRGRGWETANAYLFAFCLFLPACAAMTYSGFTLSRAGDPGHVSPRSWRRRRQSAEM